MASNAPKRRGRRGGVRLRSTPEEIVGRASENSRPIVERWMNWVNAQFDPAVIQAAAEDASGGRLSSLQILEATVIGATRGGTRPAAVTLQFQPLADAQWRKLLDRLAREAVYEASLLTGDVPGGLVEQADAAGVPLVPTTSERPVITCEPQRTEAEAERAAAAVCLCIAERLLDRPLEVFPLRGRTLDQLLDELRELRVMQVQGAASAHGDPFIAGTYQNAPPLDECVDEFWGSGAQLAELEQMTPAEHAPHALLRRLGPSPLGGKFPLMGLLASAYDTVAESARRMRDHAEHIEDGE